ncbi:MAG: TraR/DksA family transcriptional regulator [Rhodospirillaceae bacterium]|nr:TraR/DksA family transcriptional regulator [Rhodospirillaceae bacterium]MDD9926666.1 TraR/DksA family transcriptional regulator [Rhodospirillaceae bacterium]
MTMLDTEKMKQALEARRQVLSAKAEEIEGELRTPGDPDFAEQATAAEGDEVLEGLENSALLEIAKINAALARIENGSFGQCTICGAPVGEKRLETIPHAAQCISCASE